MTLKASPQSACNSNMKNSVHIVGIHMKKWVVAVLTQEPSAGAGVQQGPQFISDQKGSRILGYQ